MSVNQSFVDLVVARVLERLRSHPSVNQAASDNMAANVTTATWFFDETVLTESILNDRINGATTIQIAPHMIQIVQRLFWRKPVILMGLALA